MPKLLQHSTIDQIIQLRKHGHSFPEISAILNIPRSTAFRHSQNILILPKFKKRWMERRNSSKILSERAWFVASQKAVAWIDKLNSKERKLLVCALYWAEGNKKDLSFTNTDSSMIALFLDILRTDFKIKNSDFKISIRIYENLNEEECIKHWSAVTKINLQDNVSINILRGKKIGKLKFGMCRVRVRKGG